MAAPLLEVRNLHAGYGPTEVLHGLDFSLEEGSITALLGANGAGKTTTLRALCNMVRTSGEVLFAGERIDGKSTEDIVRLGVAHVPDGRGTFTDLTTEENLRLGAYARRDRSTANLAQDYERMYTLFPILKERRHQQAGTLSGGQQQMLAVARALMLHPRLLLLDEPSFGLAPLVVKDIFGVMRDINRTRGVSILLVEQNAAMALRLADRAHLLETGTIVRSGSSDDLMNDDAVRRAYLGY
jgi:branched-chain amino acid transport system ATP-binding protein